MLMVIVRKELARVFTDKRLVFSAFILPAVSIFVLYSIMGNMLGNMTDSMNEHISRISVFQAPDSFKAYLEEYQKKEGQVEVDFIDSNIEEAKTAILEGELDGLIEFPEGFDEIVKNYSGGTYPNINTYYNPSEENSQTTENRIQYTLLSGYESLILSQRFGGLEMLKVFDINLGNEEQKIAPKGKEAGMGLSFMLPMLLNIMLFAGAMGIGIDVIAGEKERGTMASMLLTPVDRRTIALGKVLSLGIVATISALCTFAAILASLPSAGEMLVMGEVSLDSFAFGFADYAMLLVILILQVGIFVGMICLVSVMAKSVKEAGTYVSPIYMLVMVAAFATVFTSGEVKFTNYVIPVLNNVFAIKELLTFELSLQEFATSAGISLLMIGILLKLITMAFNNERTMLNA